MNRRHRRCRRRSLGRLRRRDHRDTTRTDAPLKPAPDAILIDTTALDREAAIAAAIAAVERRGG